MAKWADQAIVSSHLHLHIINLMEQDRVPQSLSAVVVVLSVQAMVPSLEEAVLARQGPEVQVKVEQWQPHPIV